MPFDFCLPGWRNNRLLSLLPEAEYKQLQSMLERVFLPSKYLFYDVRQWLSKLTDRQREVVERRFGLNGYDPHTLAQVAIEMEVSREGVRQAQVTAIKALRQQLNRQDLSQGDLL